MTRRVTRVCELKLHSIRASLPMPVGARMPIGPADNARPIVAIRKVPSIRIVRIAVDGRWQDHRPRLVVAINGCWRRRRIGVRGRRRRLLIVTLLVTVTLLPRLRRIVLGRWRWLRLAVARRRWIGRRNIGRYRSADDGAQAERRSSHPFHQVLHEPSPGLSPPG